MPSSSRSKTGADQRRRGREVRDFTQLGLDFSSAGEYSTMLRKEADNMDQELFETLEKKVGDLLEKYTALKAENTRLNEESQRLLSEREGLKSRIDGILGKLEGI
jgi:cell division protein ZapB